MFYHILCRYISSKLKYRSISFLKPISKLRLISQSKDIKKSQLVIIYSCGITTYSKPHIGNFRVYFENFKLLKIFEFLKDNEVISNKLQNYINFTDINDKIERASDSEESYYELTNKIKEDFLDDYNYLFPNIVTTFLSCKSFIPNIKSCITSLLNKNLAEYTQKKDKKGIYLKVEKEENENFCLWREDEENRKVTFYYTNNKKKIKGVPGWHIECSTMIRQILKLEHKKTLNLHMGGSDLKIHHDNENTLLELENYSVFKYLKNKLVCTSSKEKMSKSLGNTFFPESLFSEKKVLNFIFSKTSIDREIIFNKEQLQNNVKQYTLIVNFLLRFEQRKNYNFSFLTIFKDSGVKIKKILYKMDSYFNNTEKQIDKIKNLERRNFLYYYFLLNELKKEIKNFLEANTLFLTTVINKRNDDYDENSLSFQKIFHYLIKSIKVFNLLDLKNSDAQDLINIIEDLNFFINFIPEYNFSLLNFINKNYLKYKLNKEFNFSDILRNFFYENNGIFFSNNKTKLENYVLLADSFFLKKNIN